MFTYKNGSRVVFRKSGTGSSGITLRVYFEKYEKESINQDTSDALKDLISLGLHICQIKEIAGLDKPTVET
jgi:phosphoglucomutase